MQQQSNKRNLLIKLIIWLYNQNVKSKQNERKKIKKNFNVSCFFVYLILFYQNFESLWCISVFSSTTYMFSVTEAVVIDFKINTKTYVCYDYLFHLIQQHRNFQNANIILGNTLTLLMCNACFFKITLF